MQGRAEEKPGLNFDLTRWRPYRDRVLFMIHRTYCGHRMGRWGHKKPGTWPGFHHLVAGARYANYMQIEIEPFPLVA